MILRTLFLPLMLIALSAGTASAELAASLRGSPAGMERQNRVARDHELAFYRTPADIRAAIEAGELQELEGNENYAVADFVQHPYLHPAAVLFVERLSAQYHEACGQQLVVTSAVRASSQQPANAHALSVHPAGMAVDLRVSNVAACRRWLEDAILGMERRGLIDGIREYNPPHYHIAIFPTQYMAYALERAAEEAELLAATQAQPSRDIPIALPMEAMTLVDRPLQAAPPSRGPTPGRALAMILIGIPLGLFYVLRGRPQRAREMRR